MKPAPFEYHVPNSAAETVELLAELGDGAKVLAGGQSLIPLLSLRLAVFEHLVDIGHISELKGIERRGDELCLGAGTTTSSVERSPETAVSVPLLAEASPLIGHPPIRNRGTLGGSIAHADPAAEFPGVALALDATMDVLSPRGRRTIAARDFFVGLWSTAMTSDELLLSVSFPIWGGRCGFAVEELSRRHGDFAVAGAISGIELGSDDHVTRCAIGLIGLGPTPERGYAAERAIVGRHVDDLEPTELGRLAVEGLEAVPEDLHGSATYRRKVGAVVTARALATAREEALHG
jgi:carbon-monoxide dehydrogenase medium subunit